MGYVMVTGPMGSGKSTFMRSLPKPWREFIVPPNVPDMMLDHSCRLNGMMFYETSAKRKEITSTTTSDSFRHLHIDTFHYILQNDTK